MVVEKEVIDLANLSNSEEGFILGIAEASGAGAAFLATQPLDAAFKAVACGILGFISVTLNGFWFKFVNTGKPQAIPAQA
jgi:hypothetical protein